MNVSRLVKKAKRGSKDALVQLIMQDSYPKELQILSITKQNDYTELTIRSEADVIYVKVTLQTTKGSVPLQTTKGFYDDGSSTRTLLFETTDEAIKLMIENMYFFDQQNDRINIPIN
ncbi:hypothetical protein LZ480_11390 [Solibacillus sp. MA9]|uniref:Uncharacterized protein n=1 Tax=Solibacillus palustris TaxID=2908203 RepID=A0ABS9UDS2_9BACL|nr:hypothetical protein [Solibacillus sp. MA9]MCH7322496.1 hypothetical protein [Solibacillus sp. MA9]